MPVRNKATRKRPIALRVMVSAVERREIKIAAAKADMSSAAFVRALTMAAIKRGETVVSDVRAA
jgi:hypothetical protein